MYIGLSTYHGHAMSAQGRRLGLVRPIGILGSLKLDLQPLHADLKAVHRLDRRLRRRRVVERYEAWNKYPDHLVLLVKCEDL